MMVRLIQIQIEYLKLILFITDEKRKHDVNVKIKYGQI